MEQRLPCKLVSLEPESARQFCVARLARIPKISRASSADRILTQTHQSVGITDHKSPTGLNLGMDPQPFPRRFLGNIRSMMRTIRNQGTRIKTSQLLASRSFPNMRFTSRASIAIDNSPILHW